MYTSVKKQSQNRRFVTLVYTISRRARYAMEWDFYFDATEIEMLDELLAHEWDSAKRTRFDMSGRER